MTIADIYMAKNLLVDLLNCQVTTDTLENLMLDFLVLCTDGTDLRSTAPLLLTFTGSNMAMDDWLLNRFTRTMKMNPLLSSKILRAC